MAVRGRWCQRAGENRAGGVRWAETLGTAVCDGCGMLRRNEGHWEEQGLLGAFGIESPSV